MQTQAITISASVGPDTTAKPQKAEKIGGKRIGYYYIILKSLKESRKNDVVKCFYIKGLTDFGYCVIKEGSAGDSKDKDGRDIQDRLKWQRDLHGRLAKVVRMPRLLGEFEENGNYYLVIEHIKGKPLHSIVSKSRSLRKSLLEGGGEGKAVMSYLRQAVAILHELHNRGIVHRDATLNNFMVMPAGRVAIIDMELSYSLSGVAPDPPFALGTFGYMSPEQEAMAPPTIKEDIFAIGAMLLYAWTGISPYKFVGMPEEWLRKVLECCVPDTAIAALILQCMQEDPDRRPDTAGVLQALNAHAAGKPVKGSVGNKAAWSPAQVHDALVSGIQALGSPVMSDPEKGWFAEHMTEPAEHSNNIRRAWYASFNRGVSGVLYFAARAGKAGLSVDELKTPIRQAIELIRFKYVENLVQSNTGLHFGSDGVAYALAETVHCGILEPEAALRDYWPGMLSRTSDKLSLMEGRAGQGIAQLGCLPWTGPEALYGTSAFITGQQLPDGSWPLSSKKQRYYMGEGQAGIIWYLLSAFERTADPHTLEAAIAGMRYLQHRCRKSTIVPLTWKKGDDHVSDHWWCEGNPGMALMYMKAWNLTGQQQYRIMADQMLAGHEEGRFWKGLSLCHGIAGLGETYLEAYSVLKDEQYLLKAQELAMTLITMMRLRPYGGYWFADRERHPVAGLFVGNAGILHFLLRLLHPHKFSFPGLV